MNLAIVIFVTHAYLCWLCQVSLVPCDMSNPDFQASYEESYQVYKKYQMVIHGETEEKNDKQQVQENARISTTYTIDPLFCSSNGF